MTFERRGLAIDTNVVIAALLGWHDHHEVAKRLLNMALDEEPAILPTRVLVESFSVLTRSPAPNRIAPRRALALLSESLRAVTQVVDFPAAERWHLLHEAVGDDAAGGAVYDAEIVRMAVAAGARGIVTLNRSHFERLAPTGFEVISN